MPKANASFKFEKALDDLTQIVETLEQGEHQLSLEDALTKFEQGTKLAKQCQKALHEAEQKVQLLTKNQTLEPFYTDFDNSAS